MQAERRCEQCGQMIPWGERKCPACGEDGRFLWSVTRNELLLLSVLVQIILFGVTTFSVKAYHAKERELAQQWYTAGERELKAGRAGEFFFVEDGRGEWYGITKDMLREAVLGWDSDVAVGSVLRGPPLPHVHPDHALDVALGRLREVPFIPVVHRADLTKLEGIVSLGGILKAYREAQLPVRAGRRAGVADFTETPGARG
jgi:hypothetical protein